MRNDHSYRGRPVRVGSLFSGYGGLDLAVEYATGGETIWFSEINAPSTRVFAHHWPGIPNLGDISTVDWTTVPPVDVLIGGFPCQDLSTVGKGAGLAPGTRSGLWSHMAAAIDALQPDLVVIENVRGLLSAPAIRPDLEGATPDAHNRDDATCDPATTLRNLEPDPWLLGDEPTRPLRAHGAVLGDLADLRRTARWVGLPASLAGAPHHRFRIFITAHRQGAVPDTSGLRLLTRRRDPGSSTRSAGHDRVEPPSDRPCPQRTEWLARQLERVGDTVRPARRHLHRWGRYAPAIARWEHITGRAAPAPAILNEEKGPRPASEFVEWLMGLPAGWVTDPEHGLTANQQNTALGNGVLPLQAVVALDALRTGTASR
ncbi:DNA cytosine methyltransferase [Gordonia otitidis]|uniref:DNA (cytosine-5-)-methyltransferase n=1 Tax=Gordonia otitidis (strain DSM 44809 / CCUG 52243 / JCM 12355 / NBRC 100426 / IFM 10032) TaxID=1108044 RepID=H5TIN3_GORO1|nr:DNA cytosine methyltransferase [Gordonia otitidis]GAB33341.1 putative modification methylase [Gordonia otitidis NBRC 100426]